MNAQHSSSTSTQSSSHAATSDSSAAGLDRRALLVGSSLAAAGAVAAAWLRSANSLEAAVYIADHQHYDRPLEPALREGLMAAGLDVAWLRGRRVLLKPNLVEPSRGSPQMTTHPGVVLAAAAVFRDWGADVVVGEGPGHMRDTEYALEESGLRGALDSDRLEFADLNYEPTVWVENRGRASALEGFYFPRTAAEADLIVSMPKLKTHHWMGVTASLKNMYGVIPGSQYGWPKNVLHHAGIPQTVYDINASLPKTIAIVDGIECMEGDGPIMGTSKWMGLLIVGTNPTAVDATVCRLMHVDPRRIPYLQLAAGRLGPVHHRSIEQRGSDWRALAQPFEMLDRPHLRGLRADPATLLT